MTRALSLQVCLLETLISEETIVFSLTHYFTLLSVSKEH